MGWYEGNDAGEVDRARACDDFKVSITMPSHSLQPYTIPYEYLRTYNMKHCLEGRITVSVFFNYMILSFHVFRLDYFVRLYNLATYYYCKKECNKVSYDRTSVTPCSFSINLVFSFYSKDYT